MFNSQKKNTFFGGVAILTVGAVLVKLIGALYKIPLGNVLSNETYADFNTAYNIYNVFLTISTAGLPVALSKTISEAHALGHKNQEKSVFWVAFYTFLVLGTISFVAMSVFGGPLAHIMGDDAAIYCIWAISPSVFCVSIMAAFRGYAQGHSNMVPTTVSQVIESLCKLVVGLALAFLILWFLPGDSSFRQQMAAAGAIMGVSVGSIIALIYLIVNFRRNNWGGRKLSTDIPDDYKHILSRLLKLAIPITLGSAALSIVTLVDTTVVLHLLQGMYEDMPKLISAEAYAQALQPKGVDPILFMARGTKGIYDKCMVIFNLPPALMVPLTASVIPAVSACLVRRDCNGASRISESALRIGVLICLPAGVGIFSLAGPIVQLLFPDKMDLTIATPVMGVLGLASIFVCIMLICNSILQSHGIVNLPVVIVLIGGVIKIAVNYLLVGNYEINIKGAPIGTLCCFAAVSIMDLIIIHQSIPSPPRYGRVFVKPIIATILMGFAAWGSYGFFTNFLQLGNNVATILAICTGCLVYFVLILALRVICKEDLDLMPKGDKIAKILHIK